MGTTTLTRHRYLSEREPSSRADQTLARDAEARGWISEADRHRRLIERLDAHIRQAQTG